MFGFLLTIHLLISFILIAIVLLQSGRGAQLGAAFGGIGQANTVRTPETTITKITTILAIVFMITSIGLALLSTDRASNSIINQARPTQQVPQTETNPETDSILEAEKDNIRTIPKTETTE